MGEVARVGNVLVDAEDEERRGDHEDAVGERLEAAHRGPAAIAWFAMRARIAFVLLPGRSFACQL